MNNIDIYQELLVAESAIVELAQAVNLLATKLVAAGMLSEQEFKFSSADDIPELINHLQDKKHYYEIITQKGELSDADAFFLKSYIMKYGSEEEKRNVDKVIESIVFSKTVSTLFNLDVE